MKRHRKLSRAQLHYVTCDSAIMNEFKGRTALLQRFKPIEILVLADFKRKQARLEILLENFREAIRLLAEEALQQLPLTDYKGQTLQMLIAEAGNLELVRSMLAAAADPNQQDFEDRVSFHSITATGALAVVRELPQAWYRPDHTNY